jgi:hypothetical protein
MLSAETTFVFESRIRIHIQTDLANESEGLDVFIVWGKNDEGRKPRETVPLSTVYIVIICMWRPWQNKSINSATRASNPCGSKYIQYIIFYKVTHVLLVSKYTTY